MGLEENDSRGLVLCVADLGSKRSGAATGENKGRERGMMGASEGRVLKKASVFKKTTDD